MLDGIFLGYAQHAGGGWQGDLHVVDIEELTTAEYVSDVNIKRLKSAEVDIITENGEFSFPVIEDDLQQPGGRPPYVRPKRKTPALEHIPEEEQEDFLGENSDHLRDANAFADDDLIADGK